MDTEIKAEPIRPTKQMMKMVGVAGLLIIAIGLVYYIIAGRVLVIIPFSFGVAIMTALNIFMLHLLERSVQKIIYMENKEMAKNIVRFQYLLRFFLTGAVFVAIGLIDSYTTSPPFHNPDRFYFSVWATLFPSAPYSLLTAPLISIWGALAGVFTLQLSVLLIRSFKLEQDGTEFIPYVDDEEDGEGNSDSENDSENTDSDALNEQIKDDDETNNENLE